MPTVIDRVIDFSTFKYRIEMHAHTWTVSQCSTISPAELINLYHQAGYDGVAITNHLYGDTPEKAKEILKTYNSGYYEALNEGEKLGIKVYFAAEIFIKGTELESDHLFYGITPKDLEDIFPMINNGLEYIRKNYKNDNMVIIQAHPFRGNKNYANPYPLVDGIETMNTHCNHNSRSVLAAIAANQTPEYIAIAGSDCHGTITAACASILTESLPNDSIELAALLRTKRFLHEFSGTITIPPSFNYGN